MGAKNKKKEKNNRKNKHPHFFLNFPEEIKNKILAGFMFLIAVIFGLAFFERAGIAGKILISSLSFLIGKTIFILPLIFILIAFIFLFSKYKNKWPIIIAIFLLILGISGILCSNFPIVEKPGEGGWLGYFIAYPLLKFFGFLVTQIICGFLIIFGALIFWQLLQPSFIKETRQKQIISEEKEFKERKQPLIKKIFKFSRPKFEIKKVPPIIEEKIPEIEKLSLELKTKSITETPKIQQPSLISYQRPPFELLESDRQTPSSGDIRLNSAIIKKTLQNFGISVEMSEVNIGPTVTQYTLKPAEGVKLSKITTLSNDLALALASHPIRIEAPIPGKSLVGIEVPNKIRAQVRLRDLIQNPVFQNSPSSLTIVLGRDVSGNPVYADLARMPHLLVAGSTGTGKTIFLNTLILSLLYRNSPQIMRFILIDPKRVEFPVYEALPHLLCPVILDAQKAVNALKWLVSEMERRFEILAEEKTRDINSYNEVAFREKKEPLPYIVLIIDELADLMVAKGREIEAGVVRLAQMARAVGIHLVVATQRPSVEVITGLIKANITSRVTFQVASQVDSRTVLDMAGAEKLLGSGDMLFISAEIVKPKRIQGAFVSEKEVKRVVNYIKTQNAKLKTEKIKEGVLEDQLAEDLEKTLAGEGVENFPYGEEDPLYEEARKLVIRLKKASASLLQRHLRVGYARAARLIDMLEERGVVGPADGAKPREVYIEEEKENENNDWQKI